MLDLTPEFYNVLMGFSGIVCGAVVAYVFLEYVR